MLCKNCGTRNELLEDEVLRLRKELKEAQAWATDVEVFIPDWWKRLEGSNGEAQDDETGTREV
jgi:hypothetical protein